MTIYLKIRFWTDSGFCIKYCSRQDSLENVLTIAVGCPGALLRARDRSPFHKFCKRVRVNLGA